MSLLCEMQSMHVRVAVQVSNRLVSAARTADVEPFLTGQAADRGLNYWASESEDFGIAA